MIPSSHAVRMPERHVWSEARASGLGPSRVKGSSAPLNFPTWRKSTSSPRSSARSLWKSNHLRGDSDRIDTTARRSPNARAAARRQRDRRVSEIVGVTPHRKLLSEVSEHRADLRCLRQAHSRCTETYEYAAHLSVVLQRLHLIDQIIERGALRREPEEGGRWPLGQSVGQVEHRDGGTGARLFLRPGGHRSRSRAALTRDERAGQHGRGPRAGGSARSAVERASHQIPLPGSYGCAAALEDGAAAGASVAAGAGDSPRVLTYPG